jgi:formylglycine-generating enzyme required for sulfatase activity
MHGNVREWCWDGYGKDFYKASRVDDPAGLLAAATRVIRGGNWNNDPRSCRSAYRGWNAPVFRGHGLGFRLALVQ